MGRKFHPLYQTTNQGPFNTHFNNVIQMTFSSSSIGKLRYQRFDQHLAFFTSWNLLQLRLSTTTSYKNIAATRILNGGSPWSWLIIIRTLFLRWRVVLQGCCNKWIFWSKTPIFLMILACCFCRNVSFMMKVYAGFPLDNVSMHWIWWILRGEVNWEQLFNMSPCLLVSPFSSTAKETDNGLLPIPNWNHGTCVSKSWVGGRFLIILICIVQALPRSCKLH